MSGALVTADSTANPSASKKVINWATYKFPKATDFSGILEKFSGGSGFTRWQKQMRLWLNVKGLWTVIEYEPAVLDEKVPDSAITYAVWKEKDNVASALILAALSNTLFDVYASDMDTAKMLWDKLDKTFHTDDQGLEKYTVSKFQEFKLVDGKSMTEQVHEFEHLMQCLKESGMDLP